MRTLVLLFYNILFPVLALLSTPAWLIKMYRRGGFGSGLMQRLGKFKRAASEEIKGGVYIHAVSVGEVIIALKLIKTWREKDENMHFIIVPTTSTGYDVAFKHASDKVRVIYSPVDFPWTVRKVLKRFSPQQIVLIEAEVWPNLLRIAEKRKIPVLLVNARLSKRSEKRYSKVKSLVTPIFQMLTSVCVQERGDVQRWQNLGMPEAKIKHTGSIKFDYSGSDSSEGDAEILNLLDRVQAASDVKRVIAVSTFAGEEKMLLSVLSSVPQALPVLVPRHMERRDEVAEMTRSMGYTPLLRTQSDQWKEVDKPCIIIDTTGELKDWTTHMDLAVIGKSWPDESGQKGGQNPTEAVAAKVPVIVGPRMDNFEPLVSAMVTVGGIIQLESSAQLGKEIDYLLSHEDVVNVMTERSLEVLDSHSGATMRTISELTRQR